MESTSFNSGNFKTSLKIIAFYFFVLIFPSSANGISIEVRSPVTSESINTHQIVNPNSGVQYYLPNQHQVKETPQVIPPSMTLAPPLYKYTLAYIPPPVKSLHDKPQYTYTQVQPKLVPTSSGNYVQLTNIISHQVQEEAKPYKYGYRVSDPHNGAEFGHSEAHDGNTAKGYYHVLLPDGRLQTVEYWAGPSGYHASITYDAKH